MGPGKLDKVDPAVEAQAMPVLIWVQTFEEAGLTESEALVEIACRLFDIGKLHLWPAAKLAAMSRIEFEQALRDRKIPIYCPTIEDMRADLANLKKLRQL